MSAPKSMGLSAHEGRELEMHAEREPALVHRAAGPSARGAVDFDAIGHEPAPESELVEGAPDPAAEYLGREEDVLAQAHLVAEAPCRDRASGVALAQRSRVEVREPCLPQDGDAQWHVEKRIARPAVV